jgi:hypothetical protein
MFVMMHEREDPGHKTSYERIGRPGTCRYSSTYVCCARVIIIYTTHAHDTPDVCTRQCRSVTSPNVGSKCMRVAAYSTRLRSASELLELCAIYMS